MVPNSLEEDDLAAVVAEVVVNETGNDADDGGAGGRGGKGTWKHAAFHVATTIATPAAYAPLPFALASLGWPLGIASCSRISLLQLHLSLELGKLRCDGTRFQSFLISYGVVIRKEGVNRYDVVLS